MSESTKALLIVDYNLTRIGDVSHMRDYAKKKYNARTFLIRAQPGERDKTISDQTFAANPREPNFVETALARLHGDSNNIVAGLVFSDDAVQCGAALLERLGLMVDDAERALGAFNKFAYRLSEQHHQAEMEALGIMVPDFAAIHDLNDLLDFAARHADGFVIKPMSEGNNRGVVLVKDNKDKQSAFNEVKPYLNDGVICEQIIPFVREFSYDGLGELHFITEKISVHGRYPVETAQILPARLTDTERATLVRTGKQANTLVGQRVGPFHNEIKLSDDGTQAAVVEPNRRPGGMKIWSLAEWVYGIDLYAAWVDSVFGTPPPTTLPSPLCAAATVMLGIHQDMMFSPDDIPSGFMPCEHAIAATLEVCGLSPQALTVKSFNWLSPEKRQLHRVARDNADFVAQTCITLTDARVDIRDVVKTLQQQWLIALETGLRSLK